MFSVINNGAIIGLCDIPNYIKVKDGIFISTDKDNAEGVAIGGSVYMFADNTIVKQLDGSEVVFNTDVKVKIVSGELEDTEDALCEASEDLDTRLSDIEDALCELSEMEVE